jgi:ABC-type Mn2+/Zn2+ transport system permease subunit
VNLLAFIAGPLEFELTRRALLEATVVSVACGVLGVLVVLRGLSFVSDALSHCVVPGVAVAVVTGASRELWGGVAAVLSAWLIAVLARRQVATDAAIALVYASAFALGLAIISGTRNYFADLTEILFGAILAVSTIDLVISSAVALVVLTSVALLYWPLVLTSFDPLAARAQGLPVERLDLIFFALLALAIVSGMVAVGTALVTGLLLVPAAAARLLARRVASQMVISAAIGCVASWVGLYMSYYAGIAAGAAIILAAALFFALALAAAPLSRAVGRWQRNLNVARPASARL